MGMRLDQYAAEAPQEMPEFERERLQREAEERAQARRETRSSEQKQAQVSRLKERITEQLEQGGPPQHILYAALEAIGILTDDDAWAEAGKQYLDNVYDGLAQQSLLDDNAAIQAQRISQMQESYNDRLRRQLERQLSGYHRIAKGLIDALAALGEIEE